MTDLEMKNLLDCYVETLRKEDKEFDLFFSLIEEKTEKFYILGGLLRELYLFKEKSNIRDIDIIAKGFDLKEMESFKHKKNRFGSYKFIFNTIEVDIWDFKDNWSYKYNIIEDEGTLINISKGTFFNMDSLVIDYKNKVIEKRFFENMKKRNIIDFTIKSKKKINLNPCPEINILRLLVNSEKYNLKFSNEVKKYIQNYLNIEFEKKLEKIYDSQFKHYNQEVISFKNLKNKLRKLEKK